MTDPLDQETRDWMDDIDRSYENFRWQMQQRERQAQPLVYKTFDPDQGATGTLLERKTSNDAAWHAWADAKINAAITTYDETITDAIKKHAQAQAEMLLAIVADETRQTTNELKAEIAALRAELAVVQAVQRGGAIAMKTRDVGAA
jgi:hypothetical protein